MTTEKARLALEQARSNHERLTLASAKSPLDYTARRELARAIGAGRAAWRWYQASGAGPADQIRGSVPEAFKE